MVFLLLVASKARPRAHRLHFCLTVVFCRHRQQHMRHFNSRSNLSICRRPQHSTGKGTHQNETQAIYLLHDDCVTGKPHIQQWPIYYFLVVETVRTSRNQPNSPLSFGRQHDTCCRASPVLWMASNGGCDALLSDTGTDILVLLERCRGHVLLTRGPLPPYGARVHARRTDLVRCRGLQAPHLHHDYKVILVQSSTLQQYFRHTRKEPYYIQHRVGTYCCTRENFRK